MDKYREQYHNTGNAIIRDRSVTIGDLEHFKEELLLSIKLLLQHSTQPSSKKWLKTYEVKQLLQISAGTLQTLRNNGEIPYSKIGGIIYYEQEAINKWINEKKRAFYH